MQQFITFLLALAGWASQNIDPFRLQGAYETQLFLDMDEVWYAAGGLAIPDEPLPVVMLDTIVHTDENPRCPDFTCPCWQSYHDEEAAFERRYIEVGMTERYDTLPWRSCADYSSYY